MCLRVFPIHLHSLYGSCCNVAAQLQAPEISRPQLPPVRMSPDAQEAFLCVAGTMASRSTRTVSRDSRISIISIRNSKPCRRDYRQTSFPTAWRGVSDDTWFDMGEGVHIPCRLSCICRWVCRLCTAPRGPLPSSSRIRQQGANDGALKRPGRLEKGMRGAYAHAEKGTDEARW